MVHQRAARLALALGLLLAACDQASVVLPTGSGQSEPSGGASAEPTGEPTPPVIGQLLGTWRRSPIVLDDGHVAIFSDACAAKTRTEISEDAANLPTAVVDAQGMAFAIVILADDLSAVACQLDIGPSGNDAVAASIDWFAGDEIASVDGTGISVVSYLHAMDSGRTVALGRIGPEAAKAKIPFDDASVIQAAKDNGWWATWWRGVVPAASFVATDAKDIVIGHATKPPEAVDTGVSVATWWIDPAHAAPTAKSTTIHALVREQACASGQSAEGRVEAPIIKLDAASITVTYRVRGRQGTGQDCQGNPTTPIELTLPEPLGNRTLLDGGSDPPRDASIRAP
jgi:hypothetical protein